MSVKTTQRKRTQEKDLLVSSTKVKENKKAQLNANSDSEDERPKKIKKVKIVNKNIKLKNDDIVVQSKILDNSNKKIQYVVHIADIHIHKREREEEYREVFKIFCDDLIKQKLNVENSIIVVCGDVIDNGVELHPVSVLLTKDFFIMLATITDVVCISGNHDVSVSNEEHNGLYSIIKDVKTKNNIYLLLDEGLYEYNNIIFGHTKFGENMKVINCDIETDKYKCALYHGTLSGSKTDMGYTFTDKENNGKYLNVNDFNSYDFTFLGDIHKMAFLKNNIAYPGSLIQQNIGESLDKGYILWDLDNGSGSFKKIYNNYGKVKINIDIKGKCDVDLKSLPKFIDVEIDCKSMNRKHIDDVYSKINMHDITVVKKQDQLLYQNNNFSTKIEVGGKTQDLILIKNKDDVIKLLIDQIKLNTKTQDSVILELKNLLDIELKEYNFIEASCKKTIKLISFKFDNMAIYGENNFIDFTKFKKIVGITDLNSSGKSCIIDAILQSIFGDCTRGDRSDMININKKFYKSEIILDVNGVKYKICRVATRNTKNVLSSKTKETVMFYENETNISEKKTPDTNLLIEKKICTLFDFIMTCVVTQKSLSQGKCIGFAELSGKEKKNMLCKIAKLDVYDFLANSCNKSFTSSSLEIGKYNVLLKKYNDYGKSKDEINIGIKNKIVEFEKNIEKNENDSKIKIIQKEKLQKDISQSEITLKTINEKLHEMSKNVDDFDYGDIDVKNIDNRINNIKKNIDDDISILDNKNKEKQILDNNIKKIGDIEKIKENFNMSNKNKIDELNIKIKNYRNLIWKDSIIDYSKYDKNKIDTELNKFNKDLKKIEEEICTITEDISKNEKEINQKIVIVSKTKIDDINTKNKLLENDLANLKKINNELKSYNEKYELLKNHEYDEDCEFCMKNVVTNEKIYLSKIINDYKEKIKDLEKVIKSYNLFIEKNTHFLKKYDDYLEKIKNKENIQNKNLILKKDLELRQIKKEQCHKKINDILIICENNKKYLKNKDIDDKISNIEDEIEYIRKLTCKSVEEYELLKKEIHMNEKYIAKYETKIEKMKNELDKISNIKVKYDSVKDDIEKIKLLKIEIQKDNNLFEKNKKELSGLNKQIIDCEVNIKKLQKELIETKQTQILFNELFENINKTVRKNDNYKILTSVLKDGDGIIDLIMVKNLLPKFNTIVNALFSKFGSRDISITYEKSEIKIRDNCNVNIVRDGGYQNHLNNLIYRIAMAQVNSYISTDFMIVDEAFDSADNENKGNIKKLVDYLKFKNDWTIIISHDDNVKDMFESTLKIKKNVDNKKKEHTIIMA